MKIVAIVLLLYVGIVVAFESLIGFLQPADGSTLVITTYDPNGTPHDRVVSRMETDGKTYVSANHWPRAWYHRALKNPDVQATIDGTKGNYRAVPVSGPEHDRVEREHPHGLGFRFLTGFPPRYFVRLDPRRPARDDATCSSPSETGLPIAVVERVWRSHSERAGTFLSMAACNWVMVVTRLAGRRSMTVHGPETRATAADCPADGEWIGINFALGTFMPSLPTGTLRDRNDVTLPTASARTFWLDGAAWEYPSFDNAETFVRDS